MESHAKKMWDFHKWAYHVRIHSFEMRYGRVFLFLLRKFCYAVNKEKGKWRLFVFIPDNFHREFFRLDLLVTHDLAVDVLRRVISDIIPVLFYDVGADGFSFREGNFIVEHNNA